MRIIKQEPSELVIKNSNVFLILFSSFFSVGGGLLVTAVSFLVSNNSAGIFLGILFIIIGFLLFFVIEIETLTVNLEINQLVISHKKIFKNKAVVYPMNYVKKIIMRENIRQSSHHVGKIFRYPIVLIMNDKKNPDFEIVFEGVSNGSINSSRNIGQTLAMFIKGVPFVEEKALFVLPVPNLTSLIKDIVFKKMDKK